MQSQKIKNLIQKALFGWILFGEPLTSMWWIGASIVILGVLVIVNSTDQQKEKKD